MASEVSRRAAFTASSKAPRPRPRGGAPARWTIQNISPYICLHTPSKLASHLRQFAKKPYFGAAACTEVRKSVPIPADFPKGWKSMIVCLEITMVGARARQHHTGTSKIIIVIVLCKLSRIAYSQAFAKCTFGTSRTDSVK